MNKFNVRWSKSVKIISCFISIIMILAIILLSNSIIQNRIFWIGIIINILIIFTLVFSYVLSPMTLYFDDKTIILKRGIGRIRIHINDIVNVIDFQSIQGYNIRLFGSGGIFGYTGLFKNKEIGTYYSYVGDYNQAFLITLKNNKKYLLSSEHKLIIILHIKNLIQ